MFDVRHLNQFTIRKSDSTISPPLSAAARSLVHIYAFAACRRSERKLSQNLSCNIHSLCNSRSDQCPSAIPLPITAITKAIIDISNFICFVSTEPSSAAADYALLNCLFMEMREHVSMFGDNLTAGERKIRSCSAQTDCSRPDKVGTKSIVRVCWPYFPFIAAINHKVVVFSKLIHEFDGINRKRRATARRNREKKANSSLLAHVHLRLSAIWRISFDRMTTECQSEHRHAAG